MAQNIREQSRSIEYSLDELPRAKQSISMAIVDAIAAFANTDPTEIEPLYYSVETEALNTLFEAEAGCQPTARRITFTHESYEITVDTETEPTITTTDA